MPAALFEQGAVPRFVAPPIGPVQTADGVAIGADVSLENEPGFLFDALVMPDGEAATAGLAADAHAYAFIRDQFRRCKPILALGTGVELLRSAGLGLVLAADSVVPGLIVRTEAVEGARALLAALGKPRAFTRETDPPRA